VHEFLRSCRPETVLRVPLLWLKCKLKFCCTILMTGATQPQKWHFLLKKGHFKILKGIGTYKQKKVWFYEVVVVFTCHNYTIFMCVPIKIINCTIFAKFVSHFSSGKNKKSAHLFHTENNKRFDKQLCPILCKSKSWNETIWSLSYHLLFAPFVGIFQHNF